MSEPPRSAAPLDLPVAAPDPAETIKRALRALGDTRIATLIDRGTAEQGYDALDAFLVERQQDKERIERLEAALREIASQASDRPDLDVCDYIEDYARAALAVEEDAE